MPAQIASRTPRARLSPLAAAIAIALTPAAGLAATFTVTTDADSGAGSLRQAITDHLAACGSANNIEFAITPGIGPFTIALSSPLPTVTCGGVATNLNIDGATQSGFSPNSDATGFDATIKVILDGSALTGSADCGFSHFPDPSYGGTVVVHGLKIQNFSGGFLSAGVCGTVNLFGNVLANNTYGALMFDGAPSIGSGTAQRNVFTGNSEAGLYASNSDPQIVSNFFGTPNGTTVAGNGTGISIDGGSAYIADNVVSGNSIGILVASNGATLQSNKVGIKSTGAGSLSNGIGVWIRNVSSGMGMGGNEIGGNSGTGLAIQDSSNVSSSGDFIGTAYGGGSFPNAVGVHTICSSNLFFSGLRVQDSVADGVILAGTQNSFLSSPVVTGNGGSGIRIFSDDCVETSNGNTIAGATVTGNSNHGILIEAGVQNAVYGGSIHGNGVKNINLNNSPGTTALPNDGGDLDGGPNNQQNWPEIASVVQDGTNTTVVFSLDSVPGDVYYIQIYSNATNGKPGGQTYLADTFLPVSSGVTGGSYTLTGTHDNISLTAMASFGDTSEFSPIKSALAAPALTLLPTVLDFGSIEVDGSSTQKTALVQSSGGQPLVISAITSDPSCYGSSFCYGGGFICTTTCETEGPYNPGQSCTIKGTFAPTFSGFQSESIYICSNAPGSPHLLTLVGDAVPPPPITISPSAWDFGGVAVGGTSETRSFTIRNVDEYGGSFPIAVSTTGPFTIVDDQCDGFVSTEAPCQVVVAFTPEIAGQANGELDVAIDISDKLAATSKLRIGGTVAKATLTGNGLSGGEIVLPTSINLGIAVVGGAPVTQGVVLSNTGLADVNISTLSVSAPFTLTHDCPTVLPPAGVCTLSIGYSATSLGTVNGTLTVVTDASGGSADIPVTVSAQSLPNPFLRVEPNSIGFGSRVIGSQGPSQSVTITNIGGAVATLNLASLNVDYLIASTNCGGTLASQASCTASLAFRPVGFGTRFGNLVISGNATNSPSVVVMTGTGCRPFIASGNRLGDRSNCAP